MGKTITATNAARNFSALLNKVGFRGDRVPHSCDISRHQSSWRASRSAEETALPREGCAAFRS